MVLISESRRDESVSEIEYDHIALSRKRLKVGNARCSKEELNCSWLNNVSDSLSWRECDNGGNESVLGNSRGGSGYAASEIVSSWMYVNAKGQMSGPYFTEQLNEGLSSGFLPEDLSVYPLMSGSLMKPVPLKYFKQFPDHISMGFVYLPGFGVKAPANSQTHPGSYLASNTEVSTTSVSYNSQAAYQSSVSLSNIGSNQQVPYPDEASLTKPFMAMLGDESCWFFDDDEGRKHGPHSLVELYSWHHYGYLQDSLKISHADNKFKPFILKYVVDTWRTSREKTLSISDAKDHSSGSILNSMSETFEDVCSQLHSGIMKTAHRVVFDEIISHVVAECIALKKANKYPKFEVVNQNVKTSATSLNMAIVTCSHEKALSNGISEQKLSKNRSPAWTLSSLKSVGNAKNFSDACIILSRRLFDSSVQDMWNAVLHDHIVEYFSSWRTKLWSDRSAVLEQKNSIKQYVREVENLHVVSSDEESSDEKADCPPGFELSMAPPDVCNLSPSVSSCFFNGQISRERNLSSNSRTYKDVENILAGLEHDLHSSAMMPLIHYFEFIVDEEVKEIIGCPKDDESKEVDVDPSVECSRSLLDSEKVAYKNCQVPSELENQDHENSVAVVENSLSDVLTKTLVKVCTVFSDTAVVKDIDVLDAPGSQNISENKLETFAPLRVSKIRSSKSQECYPKMTLFVALAMCRQKLHDDVLDGCKSSLTDGAFNKFWLSYRSSKKYSKPERMVRGSRAIEERPGDFSAVVGEDGESLRNKHGTEPLDKSIVTGKFAYSCKKRSRKTANHKELKKDASKNGDSGTQERSSNCSKQLLNRRCYEEWRNCSIYKPFLRAKLLHQSYKC